MSKMPSRFCVNKQAFLKHCEICGDGLVDALYSLYVDKDNSKLKKICTKTKGAKQ